MPLFDMPLPQLESYFPALAVPDDFDDFWLATLAEARQYDDEPTVRVVNSALDTVTVRDLTFSGYGGDPIKAWLVTPKSAEGPLPVVVEFLGYGSGRGLPHERLAWASAGYAHVVMDTRGQNSPFSSGSVTADAHGAGPSVAGFLTRGIESASTHYYRRVFTDAVRCVEATAALPEIDPARVVVCGTSQGGGIALAVAGLLRGSVAAALIDVPFLCHIDRAITMTDREPYAEIARYLAVQRGQLASVLETLSYIDAANHASRATAPALFSVGLFDTVCPPSTVFAAHNRYAGPSEIDVFPFNGHEGGGSERWPKHVEFVRRVLTGRPASSAAL